MTTKFFHCWHVLREVVTVLLTIEEKRIGDLKVRMLGFSANKNNNKKDFINSCRDLSEIHFLEAYFAWRFHQLKTW